MKLAEALATERPFRLECSDTEWTQPDEDGAMFCREEILYGEYEVKHEPVVYETRVGTRVGISSNPCLGYLEVFGVSELGPLADKRVRVTVEELDDAE